MLVVGLDYRRPLLAGGNLDLLLAQSPGWFLIGSIDLLEAASQFNDPAYLKLIRLVFAAVTLSTLLLLARQVRRFISVREEGWRGSLELRTGAAVAAFTMAVSLIMPFLHRPDDSTYFTELGGQRLRERGLLPYGDPLLTHSPGAAYGPLMYLAQAGVQAVMREPVNTSSPDLPVLGPRSEYLQPSGLPTQVLLSGFQLMASAALFVVGRGWGGEAMGLSLVALYNGSAYVLGVGGTTDLVGGMTYVSHVIPPAVTLLAFACLGRPALSGALLAAAAGFGFYPAFMFPAWLGYFWGRSRPATIRFVTGFGLVGLITVAWVLVASRPAPGLGLVATIVRDTLGHHTDPSGYGMSPFGLWGQQTGVLRWMLAPLAGGSALTSPFFIVFCGYLAATAWLARTAGPVGLALLASTVAMGANVWKIHATATYVTWYYPFLLIGLLGPPALVRVRRTAQGGGPS